MDGASLFGLQYIDKKDFQAFLKMDKKVRDRSCYGLFIISIIWIRIKLILTFIPFFLQISAQDMKKEDTYNFIFSCQFFPENVDEEIVNPTVLRLFWKQIQTAIVADNIYCPPELCVLFAAQTV